MEITSGDKPSILATVKCPRVSWFFTIAFKWCRTIPAYRRRLILAVSLFDVLTEGQRRNDLELARLLNKLNSTVTPRQMRFIQLISHRIWKNVLPMRMLNGRDDKHLTRFLGRAPLWFSIDNYLQQEDDIRKVISHCRELGY